MSLTIFILIPLFTNLIEGTVIRGGKFDLEQNLVEVNNPYDCTKYFSCQRISHNGFLAHLLQCPKGTSFLPRFLKGSCNGPDPKDGLDFFKDLDQGPMWSDWSAWYTCSSSCGDQATKKRSRLCISEPCNGDDIEIGTCVLLIGPLGLHVLKLVDMLPDTVQDKMKLKLILVRICQNN